MQENLVDTFQRLKVILKEYEGPFTPKFDLESKYDLWSIKDVEIAGRRRKGVYFAGLIIQSKYVGFNYMPIYADTDLKHVFEPELLNLLKGKSCFHIKKLDDGLVEQIREALKTGHAMYQERGWV